MLWVDLEDNRFDSTQDKEISSKVEIFCVGTGAEFEKPNARYLSTVQYDGIVAHFYCNVEPFYK